MFIVVIGETVALLANFGKTVVDWCVMKAHGRRSIRDVGGALT
jgi:hypothetical protein